MWLADTVTAVVGVLFLTAPLSVRFNTSSGETWTYVAGGALLLLLGALTLNWDEYRHPWHLHVGAILVGVWFVVAPFALPPAGRAADGWTPIAGGTVVIALNGWMAARQLSGNMPAH